MYTVQLNLYRKILESEGFKISDMALIYFHSNAHLEPRVWINVHRLDLEYNTKEGKFEFDRRTKESFAETYKLKTWKPNLEQSLGEIVENNFFQCAAIFERRVAQVEHDIDEIISQLSAL